MTQKSNSQDSIMKISDQRNNVDSEEPTPLIRAVKLLDKQASQEIVRMNTDPDEDITAS